MLTHTLLNHPLAINLHINNSPIKRVMEFKFLGVWFDSSLKWNTHIDNIKNLVSKFIGVIYRIRNTLDNENIKLIYNSLVYPHLTYCSAIWGGAYHTSINSLFITQKKLIRVMFHGQRYDHTNPYFSEHKILTVPHSIHLQTILFVYNSIKNLPANADSVLLSGAAATRRPYTLRLPLCRTSHAQQSVLVRGARQWNLLPDQLKLATSKHT